MTNSNCFCDQCGTRLKATSRYCPSCGRSLDTDGASTPEKPTNQASSAASTTSTQPCPNCNTHNVRSAERCKSCWVRLSEPAAGNFRQVNRPMPRQGPKPSNYLPQAILVTLFCCIPAGIVAIVYAAQVNGKWESGHQHEAEEASNSAKQWCWIGALLSLGIGFIYGIYWSFSTA